MTIKDKIAFFKKMIANNTVPEDEKELYREKLLILEKEETTSKKTTSKKTPLKKTEKRETMDNIKDKIKVQTGKSEQECLEILAKYKEIAEKNKKRVNELAKADKLITGTDEIKASKVIDNATNKIADKIIKEVEQAEKEANIEAKKEVQTKGKTEKEIKDSIDKKVVIKLEKEVSNISKEMVLKTSKFIIDIQLALKKESPKDSKLYLISLRNEIDKMLSKFDAGGTVRRTKEKIQKDEYNKEVDSYKWFVVEPKIKKIHSGFEFKADANDLLEDFDKGQCIVIAKTSLKSFGYEDPTDEWKYSGGGVTKGEKIDWTTYYSRGGSIMGKKEKALFFNVDGERKIDLPTIKKLTEYINSLPQTKSLNTVGGVYEPNRIELHKEILAKFKKGVICIDNVKPIAILMGGSPASGKSSFLKKYAPYLLKEEIFKIDADEVRAMLPEYEGWNASQTHFETKDIVEELLSNREIGMPCNTDLIYDGTMNNTKTYKPLIKMLKGLGYDVFLVYIDNVKKDVIIDRALKRYQTSGRFVPLEVIEDFFEKGKTALEELKIEATGYMVVDGGNQDYNIIEKGGKQIPKSRAYSKIGYPISK